MLSHCLYVLYNMELHKLDPGPKSGKSKKSVVCSLATCRRLQ